MIRNICNMKQQQRIVLISCSAKKQMLPNETTIQAKYLYISSLFRKSLQYAIQLNPHKIFILSAKFGLLRLNDYIGYYDETLNKKSVAERHIWAEQVLKQLHEESCELTKDKFIFLAGKKYYQYLIGDGRIQNYYLPYKQKKIGKILQFLNSELNT